MPLPIFPKFQRAWSQRLGDTFLKSFITVELSIVANESDRILVKQVLCVQFVFSLLSEP